MEKEMKKMLLVAVSVGVFLLVTITVAILLLTPKAGTENTAFSSSYTYPAGRTQPAIENSGNAQQQQEIFRDTDINGIRDNTVVSITGDRNNGDSLTINIPKPGNTIVSDTARIQPAASASASSAPDAANITVIPAAAATVVSAAAQTTQAARPAASSGSALVSSTASVSAARQTVSNKTLNDYWVQTGAFSAIVRAEDAKELLASKGITSIIENRIVNGKLWYRVRLGPYTSENEANYWLALVKSIDGFTESQVRQTVRQQ